MIATIVSGFVSTVIWISTPLEDIISSRFTTFAIAMIIGIIFSLLFPDKPKSNESISSNKDRNPTQIENESSYEVLINQ